MMKFLPVLFIFFDIAPPEPFKFGAAGKGAAVAFGLFLSAIAAAGFLLFRKKLSTRIRTIIAGILLLAGVGGAISIWAVASAYDAEAERNRPRYKRVPNPYARQQPESNETPPASNNNSHGNKLNFNDSRGN